jgi:hypothetical protein
MRCSSPSVAKNFFVAHRFARPFVALANPLTRRLLMTDANAIREHMEVIGADGVHVGTVDSVDGDRIKLTKSDSTAQMGQSEGSEDADLAQMEQGEHAGHHHYISLGLVAGVEGDQVRLSATAANAVTFEEEEGQQN